MGQLYNRKWTGWAGGTGERPERALCAERDVASHWRNSHIFLKIFAEARVWEFINNRCLLTPEKKVDFDEIFFIFKIRIISWGTVQQCSDWYQLIQSRNFNCQSQVKASSFCAGTEQDSILQYQGGLMRWDAAVTDSLETWACFSHTAFPLLSDDSTTSLRYGDHTYTVPLSLVMAPFFTKYFNFNFDFNFGFQLSTWNHMFNLNFQL